MALTTTHLTPTRTNPVSTSTEGRSSTEPCLAALLVLTVITVLASTVDWGGGMTNVIIAMIIASIKGSLVALFFMHLRWDKPMTSIIFCSTLFFLGLFLIGCYTDQTARPMLEPTNLKAPLRPVHKSAQAEVSSRRL